MNIHDSLYSFEKKSVFAAFRPKNSKTNSKFKKNPLDCRARQDANPLMCNIKHLR